MNIQLGDRVRYRKGLISIFGRLRIKEFPETQEGMVCGVRNLSLARIEGMLWEKSRRVYLVAQHMQDFDKVPEDFIEEVIPMKREYVVEK